MEAHRWDHRCWCWPFCDHLPGPWQRKTHLCPGLLDCPSGLDAGSNLALRSYSAISGQSLLPSSECGSSCLSEAPYSQLPLHQANPCLWPKEAGSSTSSFRQYQTCVACGSIPRLLLACGSTLSTAHRCDSKACSWHGGQHHVAGRLDGWSPSFWICRLSSSQSRALFCQDWWPQHLRYQRAHFSVEGQTCLSRSRVQHCNV